MIQSITDQNLEECVSAYLKAYNAAPWNYNWSYDGAKKYLLEYVESKQFIGFAMYDEGKVVAALFAHQKTWWTNTQVMIDELFVSGEKQRMGYGKRLLNHFYDYAADNNINTVVLMTNKYMPSYNFYLKDDYIDTEQYVFMFKQI
jgi:GNAT superfamily N-acetyltransferase